MATRRYSLNPQDHDYQTLESVGAATVNKRIELTVDFDAMAASGLSDQQAKLQVMLAIEKLKAYIETRSRWKPA